MLRYVGGQVTDQKILVISDQKNQDAEARILETFPAATLVERWSPPPDDNLWMPILSGLVMAVIQGFIGGWENIALFSLWG